MRRAAATAALVIATLIPTPAHAADTGTCWDHAPRCAALEELHGAGLDQDRDLQTQAMTWAEQMAASGILSHSVITYGAETVGMGPDTATILAAFMQSPEHRAILLDPSLHRVGIGHAWAGGTLFISVRWDY